MDCGSTITVAVEIGSLAAGIVPFMCSLRKSYLWGKAKSHCTLEKSLVGVYLEGSVVLINDNAVCVYQFGHLHLISLEQHHR